LHAERVLMQLQVKVLEAAEDCVARSIDFCPFMSPPDTPAIIIAAQNKCNKAFIKARYHLEAMQIDRDRAVLREAQARIHFNQGMNALVRQALARAHAPRAGATYSYSNSAETPLPTSSIVRHSGAPSQSQYQ
jgi:hypothetical protein